MNKFYKILTFLFLLLIGYSPLCAVDVWDGTAVEWTQGSGTAEDPYLIESAENLAYLAKVVNGGDTLAGVYFSQTQDLDMDSLAWTPIGNASHSFNGVYDGKNLKIENVRISTGKYAGLFGKLKDATIQNVICNVATVKGRFTYCGGFAACVKGDVSFENCCFLGMVSSSSSNDSYSGGFVGYVNGGNVTIIGCTSSGMVSSSVSYSTTVRAYSGGFVGGVYEGDVTIKGCTSSGTVSSETLASSQGTTSMSYSGGFVGILKWKSSATITECTLSGTVESSAAATGFYNVTDMSYSGGFVGQAQSNSTVEITGCTSSGNVSGDNAGGYVGSEENSRNAVVTITDCTSSGNVSGSFAGGYVGSKNGAKAVVTTITGCTSSGNVSGNYAGGFVGDATEGNVAITGCTSSGIVSSEKVAGGFVGYEGGETAIVTIAGCTSSGIVSSEERAGGVIGYEEYAGAITITCSTSSGNVSSEEHAGGFVGYVEGKKAVVVTIAGCTSSGTVSSEEHAGGFIGYERDGSITITCSASFGTVSSISTTNASTYSGGFVGYKSWGDLTITDCIFSGKISSTSSSTSSSSTSCSGGFVGRSSGNPTIIGCISSGKISSTFSSTSSSATSCSGGFVGRSSGNPTIIGCISSGKISSTSSSTSYSGGFVGDGTTEGKVESCVFSGAIKEGKTQGAIVASGSLTVIDTYYLEGSCSSAGGGVMKTAEEMASDEFLSILNQDTVLFEKDIEPMVNNGAPVLKGLVYVVTDSTHSVSGLRASVSGVVKNVENVEEVGFEYAMKESTDFVVVKSSLSDGRFSAELTGLKPGQNYVVRSYCIGEGTCGKMKFYGNLVPLTTLSCDPIRVVLEEAICEMDTYDWNGTILSEAGVYRDTLTAANGCDSIIELTLEVLPVKFTPIEATICENAEYDFLGTICDKAGVYRDTLTAENGCDSIIELTLEVLPVKFTPIEATICENAEYDFLGTICDKAGIYRDTLTAENGCDSIIELTLEVLPVKFTPISATICENAEYDFLGTICDKAGVYRDTLTAANGCDSIIELTLEVLPVKFTPISATICENAEYDFLGTICDKAGVYRDTLTAENGCDSIIELMLEVLPVKFTPISATICENAEYDFLGTICDKAGVYRDTLTAENGCDSIIELTLEVLPVKFTPISATICENGEYDFLGTICDKAGVYRDTLTAENGCDSIIELTLEVLPVKFTPISATICENAEYDFLGTICDKSGVYRDTLTAENGCDSIIELTLEVLPVKFTPISATICENGEYDFLGTICDKAGVYRDTLTAANGCDSIIELTLEVLPVKFTPISATICENAEYDFLGTICDKAGVYRDTLTAENGCDSIIELTLEVLPVKFTPISATICENAEYDFLGTICDKAGVYRDTLTAENGCDSIIELTLEVLPVKFTPIEATICENGEYDFLGTICDKAGVYRDTLTAENGCDSIIELTLEVLPVKFTPISATICENAEYDFLGTICDKAGVYRDTLTAENGCDSIIELTLEVLPVKFTPIEATICENAEYDFLGTICDKAGIYRDTLTAENGCDSIIELTLEVLPVKFTPISATICENAEYDFLGTICDKAGVYRDTLTAENGCDSIIELTLEVLPVKFTPIEATICENAEYDFLGTICDKAGIYRDTLTAENGCDSIIELTLEVLPVKFTPISATICENGEYDFLGTICDKAGVYRDTLTAENGCDSIIELTLEVLPVKFTPISATICENAEYDFLGTICDKAGVYRDTLTAANGCDSIIELTLEVLPVKFTPISATICENGEYDFLGTICNKAGVYRDTLTAENGCDSIIELTLEVLPVKFTPISATICENGEYDFLGTICNKAGVYRDTLTAENGCDSIIELTLEVLPVKFTPISATICENAEYDFLGTICDKAGIYRDTLTAANGCDSIIELTLEVLPVKFTPISATICENGEYDFLGTICDKAGVYRDTLTAENGCDSIIELTLEVLPVKFTPIEATICEGEVYNFNGKTCAETGVYRDTLTSVNGCDSIVELMLTVNQLEPTFIDVNICSGKSYSWGNKVYYTSGIYYDTLVAESGCDSIVILNLIVDPMEVRSEEATICYGQSFMFNDKLYADAGIYRDTVQVESDCDYIVELNLKVELCQDNRQVIVYTEPLTILFNGITTEYVEVYNALSQLLYEGTAERVPVPAAGVYIVKVDDEVVKVLVSD